MRRPEPGERVVMVAPGSDNGRAWSIAGIVNQSEGMSDKEACELVDAIAHKTRLRFPQRALAVVDWAENRKPPKGVR